MTNPWNWNRRPHGGELALALPLFACLMTVGCKSEHCVIVPISTESTDNSVLTSLVADLNSLEVNATLEVEFKDQVERSFQELSDDNAALAMLLNTIVCLTERESPISDEMARMLVETVRAQYAKAHGLMGSGPLSPVERSFIDKSPEAPRIYEMLGRLKVD